MPKRSRTRCSSSLPLVTVPQRRRRPSRRHCSLSTVRKNIPLEDGLWQMGVNDHQQGCSAIPEMIVVCHPQQQRKRARPTKHEHHQLHPPPHQQQHDREQPQLKQFGNPRNHTKPTVTTETSKSMRAGKQRSKSGSPRENVKSKTVGGIPRIIHVPSTSWTPANPLSNEYDADNDSDT
jgi:hypothetical protein